MSIGTGGEYGAPGNPPPDSSGGINTPPVANEDLRYTSEKIQQKQSSDLLSYYFAKAEAKRGERAHLGIIVLGLVLIIASVLLINRDLSLVKTEENESIPTQVKSETSKDNSPPPGSALANNSSKGDANANVANGANKPSNGTSANANREGKPDSGKLIKNVRTTKDNSLNHTFAIGVLILGLLTAVVGLVLLRVNSTAREALEDLRADWNYNQRLLIATSLIENIEETNTKNAAKLKLIEVLLESNIEDGTSDASVTKKTKVTTVSKPPAGSSPS